MHRSFDDPATDVEAGPRTLRSLAVVERVCSASKPVTVPQLAMWLDVPKASMARLVARLVAEGYLVALPGEFTYVPGPRLTRMALGTLGGNPFRREVRAVLREVVDALGETCNLAVMAGEEVMLVERVESDQPLRLHLDVGSRAPLHCTAGGKLFLARLPPGQRTRMLELMPLRRMTPRTLVRRDDLDRELDRLAALDLGIDDQEFVQGMIGVAVPIGSLPAGADAPLTAAVVCHAAAARVGLDELVARAPLLRRAAAQLMRCLGGAGRA